MATKRYMFKYKRMRGEKPKIQTIEVSAYFYEPTSQQISYIVLNTILREQF